MAKIENKSYKNAVRRGINISDCKKGIVNIGDKVFDKDGEECWISNWFDGVVEVDYRNEKWSVKGQYYTVYLAQRYLYKFQVGIKV